MRSFRQIAITALITIGAFSAVTYTACTKTEDPWNKKFVGAFLGNENCAAGSDNYTITVTAGSSDNAFTLTNLYNEGFSASCTKTGDLTFSFTGTQASTTFTGSGSINGNQLTVAYQINNPSSTPPSNNCTFIGTK